MVETGMLVLAGMGVVIVAFLGLFVYAAYRGTVEQANPSVALGDDEYGEGPHVELEREDR